jgi:hypothetical protein
MSVINEGFFSAFRNPPAIVVQAFDEEKALAECRALIEQRDGAKGEFKDAIIALGQKLIEARRAMPGQPLPNGRERHSPAFVAFFEKCGLSRSTANSYMSYARDPKRLEKNRDSVRQHGGGSRYARHRTLKEMLAAINNGYSLAEIKAAIQKELSSVPQ